MHIKARQCTTKTIMTRISVIVVAILLSGDAQAAAPQFDMNHFCADFAQNHASGNMGEMAKAVCMLSEESTKAVIDQAWSRVSAQNREACLKAAGQSYVNLAHCLNSLPQQ